jgi:hypothetical protein
MQSSSRRRESARKDYLETAQELADDKHYVSSYTPPPKRPRRDLGVYGDTATESTQCVDHVPGFGCMLCEMRRGTGYQHLFLVYAPWYVNPATLTCRLEVREKYLSTEYTAYNREHAGPNDHGSDLESFIVDSEGTEVRWLHSIRVFQLAIAAGGEITRPVGVRCEHGVYSLF